MKRFIVGVTPYLDDGIQYVPLGYLRGLRHIGAQPLVIRYETPLAELRRMVSQLDGMLFTGGEDVEPAFYGAYREPVCGMTLPVRDRLEIPLLQRCMQEGLPVLGICRGSQIINVALGGTLVQDVPTRYGTVHQMTGKEQSAFAHQVRVVRGTRLYARMNGDIAVDSYHHQCVNRLGDGLVASAYAPEGFIEAYESEPDAPFLMAVQWHPEVSLGDDMFSYRIFEAFGEAMHQRRV